MTILSKINQITRMGGLEIRRASIPRKDTTQFGELAIIETMLSKLGADPKSGFVIDIGASDGVNGSNTYPLFRQGYAGMAIEPVPERFVDLAHAFKLFKAILLRINATPENIIDILKSCNTPENPTFMNFDIDSYDYYLLSGILTKYRPQLICAEINEKIPTPIKFKVVYNQNPKYDHTRVGNFFFGMSISALGDICKEFNYDIITLNYNNAFIVPHERNVFSVALTPEEAYLKGYVEKRDRKEKFPWNANMESLLHMNAEEGIAFINKQFSEFEGDYIVSL
jgi:hypothetical protein